MRYKRLELVSQAEGHGFESRLPLKKLGAVLRNCPFSLTLANG